MVKEFRQRCVPKDLSYVTHGSPSQAFYLYTPEDQGGKFATLGATGFAPILSPPYGVFVLLDH
jgi:hypothetical protein